MSDLRPRINCPLNCGYHDHAKCVGNFIHLNSSSVPISLGMHIGLSQVYGDGAFPPCVHGKPGSAYWSARPK